MIYLVWIVFLSGAAIGTMVGLRFHAIRAGRHHGLPQPALFANIQDKIDWLAVLIVLLFREGLRRAFFAVLHAARRLGYKLKVLGVRIEKKFERVIDLVHGKHVSGRKGAVSFFLREIGDRKKMPKRLKG